jgi:hypothetical protein
MKRTDEKFKREVLGKIVVWHPTGFFGVRHRTRGAATSQPGAKLNRDHVYTRRFLVDQILLGANLRDIFEMGWHLMLCHSERARAHGAICSERGVGPLLRRKPPED